MAVMTLRLESLPEKPLDAAAYFYANCIQGIRKDFGTLSILSCLTIVFEAASHDHSSWRLAAIQELAREMAPHRVNALTSDSEKAIAAALAYLATAEGVTGQLLELDDTGAGVVLSFGA